MDVVLQTFKLCFCASTWTSQANVPYTLPFQSGPQAKCTYLNDIHCIL